MTEKITKEWKDVTSEYAKRSAEGHFFTLKWGDRTSFVPTNQGGTIMVIERQVEMVEREINVSHAYLLRRRNQLEHCDGKELILSTDRVIVTDTDKGPAFIVWRTVKEER